MPEVLCGKWKIRNPLVRACMSEFVGTFILVLICDCSIAVQVLSKAQDVDLLAIGFAVGSALMLCSILGAKVSGGHVNPAVTLAVASLGKMPWKNVPWYFLAQYLGGFVGTALAYANHFSAITVFDGGVRSAFFNETSTAGIFTTHPSQSLPLLSAVYDQILAVGLLQFGIMALVDRKNMGVPIYILPIGLLFLLMMLVPAFGLNCGPALNPARDIPARLFALMVGYGSEVFNPHSKAYWFTGGFLGPHLGGVIGAWVYYLLIELHLDDPETDPPVNKEAISLKKVSEA